MTVRASTPRAGSPSATSRASRSWTARATCRCAPSSSSTRTRSPSPTALDAERKAKGPRGPLHGIPVLIKDNIATADRMQTTAGSLALVGAMPSRDAFVVERLRAAGAVILGKTNLSEWANFRSTHSSSGWSGRGGQCRNPYALDRTPSGSSSGSGRGRRRQLLRGGRRHRDRRLHRLALGGAARSSASSRRWGW